MNRLPKTDSRLRKDVRDLEDGNLKAAQDNREVLQAKVRSTRPPYRPRWFLEDGEFPLLDSKYWELSRSKSHSTEEPPILRN